MNGAVLLCIILRNLLFVQSVENHAGTGDGADHSGDHGDQDDHFLNQLRGEFHAGDIADGSHAERGNGGGQDQTHTGGGTGQTLQESPGRFLALHLDVVADVVAQGAHDAGGGAAYQIDGRADGNEGKRLAAEQRQCHIANGTEDHAADVNGLLGQPLCQPGGDQAANQADDRVPAQGFRGGRGIVQNIGGVVNQQSHEEADGGGGEGIGAEEGNHGTLQRLEHFKETGALLLNGNGFVRLMLILAEGAEHIDGTQNDGQTVDRGSAAVSLLGAGPQGDAENGVADVAVENAGNGACGLSGGVQSNDVRLVLGDLADHGAHGRPADVIEQRLQGVNDHEHHNVDRLRQGIVEKAEGEEQTQTDAGYQHPCSVLAGTEVDGIDDDAGEQHGHHLDDLNGGIQGCCQHGGESGNIRHIVQQIVAGDHQLEAVGEHTACAEAEDLTEF